MKRAIFTLLAAMAVYGLATAERTVDLEINKATSAPTIDGDGAEEVWDAQTAQALEQTIGTTGAGVITANFKMTYDDNNIYILVSVEDATPNNDGSSTWQSDCVELFFAMDTTDASAYRPGDWQIRKLASKTQDDGGVDGSSNVSSTLLNDPNFIVEQLDGATYVQEWQLPIQTLVDSANFDGEYFRFDIQVADNDGSGNERTGQLFWNSNADNQWSTIQNQGTIKLKEKLGVKSIASASLIRIKANNIEFAKTVKEVNVYNITGQLMLKARNVNSISTTALKSGVYFVVADNEKAKFVIK